MITRGETLRRAEAIVTGHRATDYGTPEDSFNLIASLWSAYLAGLANADKYLTGTDVAMMMALLKIARICGGTGTDDSFVDLAGYAACGAECASVPQNLDDFTGVAKRDTETRSYV